MATITVVRPRVVFPGNDSFFGVFNEAASLNTNARGILLVDDSANIDITADDPAVGTLVGQNMAGTANGGSAGTDVTMFCWSPSTILEINSNATGTDPQIGDNLDFEFTVGTAPAQEWVANLTVTTASSGTNLGTATYVAVPSTGAAAQGAISPRDALLDTNVRVYVRTKWQFLAFHYGSATS